MKKNIILEIPKLKPQAMVSDNFSCINGNEVIKKVSAFEMKSGGIELGYDITNTCSDKYCLSCTQMKNHEDLMGDIFTYDALNKQGKDYEPVLVMISTSINNDAEQEDVYIHKALREVSNSQKSVAGVSKRQKWQKSVAGGYYLYDIIQDPMGEQVLTLKVMLYLRKKKHQKSYHTFLKRMEKDIVKENKRYSVVFEKVYDTIKLASEIYDYPYFINKVRDIKTNGREDLKTDLVKVLSAKHQLLGEMYNHISKGE